jgi:photosystem II stability/assembly factor-like uncharacterized protein
MKRSIPSGPTRLAAIVLISASAWLAGAAQAPARMDAEALRRGYDTYKTQRDASPFKSATWMFLGPTNISGRATDIAVADRNGRRRIYGGYATGGVWKTDDNGASWQAVFEHMPSTSIGDLAVAPSNPDIVWVGTGEANIFRASMPGVGIYKSTDAGTTWQHMGLSDTQTIARILVHPTNPDIVYVAASGHEWTDNAMRGVFKTTDGGRTWNKIYYKSPRTGAIDLVMDPRDPNVLYAALWQRIRRKWSDPRVEPGYNEGGIIKTVDGGRTWTDVNAGLPAPQFRGRIGIDIARSKPDVLYAFVDNYEEGRGPQPNERDAYGRPITNGRIKSAEIYRSDDAGKTWVKTSENNNYMINHSGTYGWVFGQIRVDPTDENVIYTMGLGLNISRDGGRTFSQIGGTHGDHHGLWIDPANPKILYSANDGGVYLTETGGVAPEPPPAPAGATAAGGGNQGRGRGGAGAWRFAVSVSATQFYNVELDTASPFHAYGSIQDVGSRRATVELGPDRRVTPQAFENAPGGEGSNHAVDPNNPNIVYSHGFYGNFTRTDLGQTAQGGRGGRGGASATSIQPTDPDAELRAQWMAPFFISPHNSQIVYAGYQFLFRSKDRGDSWEKISKDLTNNNAAEMLLKNSTAIPYQTIVTITESPKKQGLFYVGTDDGRIHTTIDDGKEWIELTTRIPSRKWISRIVASQHAEGTLYIAQRGREDDDFAPYLYKSTDFGKTFKSIAANLPAGSINVIREDPRSANVLYVGTDIGVFVSTDGGTKWSVLGGNLPSVQVSDLQFHKRENVLVISTYGRGMFVMDVAKLPG